MNIIAHIPELSNPDSSILSCQDDKKTARDRMIDKAIENAYNKKLEAENRFEYRFWSLTALLWIEQSYTPIQNESDKSYSYYLKEQERRNRIMKIRNSLNWNPNR